MVLETIASQIESGHMLLVAERKHGLGQQITSFSHKTVGISDHLFPISQLGFCAFFSKLSMATTRIVPHLMTLADLSPSQIRQIIRYSHNLKQQSLPWLDPLGSKRAGNTAPRLPPQSLFNKTIALLFSKRSTRTRLAAETSSALLGGRALFLGLNDIQLGINESPRDTARVVGGMCQGIFARVGEHAEIEVRTYSCLCS